MEKIRNIELAFKCPLSIEDLSKSKKGYYCKHCSNRIVDFTSKCNAELVEEINNSPKAVCGIFTTNQLSTQFLKYAAATIIVTSSISYVAYGQATSKAPATTPLSSDSVDNNLMFGRLEVSPQPVGGYPKFYEALSKELKYPKGLNVKGKCFVQFTIDSLGRVDNFKILKGLSPEADAEAIRALKKISYPFTPGELRGKRVTRSMIIPIAFDPHHKKRN
jgi:TonB family protein